jgi:hypothetical protein
MGISMSASKNKHKLNTYSALAGVIPLYRNTPWSLYSGALVRRWVLRGPSDSLSHRNSDRGNQAPSIGTVSVASYGLSEDSVIWTLEIYGLGGFWVRASPSPSIPKLAPWGFLAVAHSGRGDTDSHEEGESEDVAPGGGEEL